MFKKLKEIFQKEYKLRLKLSLRSSYQTLNKLEISKDNLLQNYHYLSSLDKKLKIAPVLKSNAYGHGIQLVGKILDQYHTPGVEHVEHKIPFFCVDSLYEAYELLKVNIKTSILIMGYTVPDNFKVKKLPFKYTIYDLETAEVLNKYQPGAKLHLFVDTGLSREGITLAELPKVLEGLKALPNIEVEGLMSHLSSSESDKDALFLNQVKNFKKAQEILKRYKINPKWIHLSASGALTNPKTRNIIAKISNLTRAGISLYGFNNSVIASTSTTLSVNSMKRSIQETSLTKIATSPSSPRNDNLGLKPVLILKTKLVQIKPLKKGEKVGYDGTFVAKKGMVIGVLPIGYNDGVDRKLSNQGVVLVNGIPCKILGKVSMNITTVDLTNYPNAQKGEEVIVYSSNPQDPNSIEQSAKLCQTIPYELLIHLNSSIKRIII